MVFALVVMGRLFLDSFAKGDTAVITFIAVGYAGLDGLARGDTVLVALVMVGCARLDSFARSNTTVIALLTLVLVSRTWLHSLMRSDKRVAAMALVSSM